MKKTVVLKISGELFAHLEACASFMQQLVHLHATHHLGIVVGGGNRFRARNQGIELNLKQTTADTMGMLATVMNGLHLHDLCTQYALPAVLLSACEIPRFVAPITQQALDCAKEKNQLVIFCGGTGNPFFTTDTNAVLRGLQMGAHEVWKGTNIDYIYDADPKSNPGAQAIRQITHQEALVRQLKIMDLSAFALAASYNMPLRIFNIFASNALAYVSTDQSFGSTVRTQ